MNKSRTTRLALPRSAIDLAVAMLRGAENLPAGDRHRALLMLLGHGPVQTLSAAYQTAFYWARAVSKDLRPPDPIVFRCLGRNDDWLAALVFLTEVLRASEQRLASEEGDGAGAS